MTLIALWRVVEKIAPSIITDIYTTLLRYFPLTFPSTSISIFDQPHHLFPFLFFRPIHPQQYQQILFHLHLHHPTTKPPSGLSNSSASCQSLGSRPGASGSLRPIESAVPGVTWESIHDRSTHYFIEKMKKVEKSRKEKKKKRKRKREKKKRKEKEERERRRKKEAIKQGRFRRKKERKKKERMNEKKCQTLKALDNLHSTKNYLQTSKVPSGERKERKGKV